MVKNNSKNIFKILPESLEKIFESGTILKSTDTEIIAESSLSKNECLRL